MGRNNLVTVLVMPVRKVVFSSDFFTIMELKSGSAALKQNTENFVCSV